MNDTTRIFFGLKGDPFGKQICADDLWVEPSREDAITRLVDTALGRSHALVLGDPGTGKNCLVRAMSARLPATDYRVASIAHVTVGPRDFLRQVSLALGLPPHGTAAAVFEAIQRSIRTTWAEHRIHPVLVLDEVHLMPDRTLSHLHVLTNFDLDSNPLLSLILVGLPELQDRLKLGVHRSLLTRIRTSVQVSPTTLTDTAAYVSRRLELVGSRSDIFVSDGMTMLHELAAGVPRVVDTLAWRAMQLAAQREERVISRATVRRAWQDTPLA